MVLEKHKVCKNNFGYYGIFLTITFLPEFVFANEIIFILI